MEIHGATLCILRKKYMPNSQIEHLNYTLSEWAHHPYFCEVTNYLKKHQIKNYIDIGANVGGVCKHLFQNIQKFETAYLFEPQKDNFNFMVNLFKDNKNVNCINQGIYYGVTQGALHMNSGNVGGYSLIKYSDLFVTENCVSNFTTLENFTGLNNIDFIKIDTEGAEYNIIENSSILKSAKFLDIEFHMSPTSAFGDLSDVESIKNYIKQYLPNFEIIINIPTNYLLKNTNYAIR